MQMLQGTNIRLRAVEASDLDFVHSCENDTNLWHLGATAQPFSKAAIEEYIEAAQHDIYSSKQLRMMIDTLDGRTIGMVDLFDFDPKNQKVGIGILIANPNDRQHGYAKDAIDTLSDYCFDILGLHQIYCHITTDNGASMALFTASGYAVCGEMKDWVRKGNSFVSAIIMQKIKA